VAVFASIQSIPGPGARRGGEPTASLPAYEEPEPGTRGVGGARSAAGRPGTPAFVLLVHVHEAEEAGVPVTQAEAARTLGRSQPTISRTIAQLQRQALLRGRPYWTGDRPVHETVYLLTPAGERAAARAIAEARALPSRDPGLSLGDLLDLHGGLSLTDLLAVPPGERSVGGEALARRLAERRAAARAPGTSPPSASVDLIGRWAERLDLLRAIVGVSAPGAHGAVRVLLGPAGQGKTRLLAFAEEVARRRGFRVVRGQTLRDPQLPFSPFEEMMDRVRAASPGPPSRAGGPRPLPRRLLRYLELLQDGPPGPLLLVVDDLQFAEPPALTIFRFLSRNLPTLERPVLLLAAARDDEPLGSPRSRSFAELLEELERPETGLAPSVVIPPLTNRESHEVAELASRREGPALPEPMVGALVARARGNPLFLVEGVREFQQAARHVDPADLPALSLSAPPSLRRLLATRFEQLPPEHRSVLEACSLLEEEFSADPLFALPDLGEPSEVARRLDELVAPWAMLVRRGDDRFAFTHVLFQEALAERAAARRDWTASLARWWEARRPGEVRRIAHLYGLARDPDRAMAWLERALQATLREQAYGALDETLREMRAMVELRPRRRAEQVARELALVERLWLAGAPVASERIARDLAAQPLSARDRILALCFRSAVNVLRASGDARDRLTELARRLPQVPSGHRDEARGAVAATAAYLYGTWGEWTLALDEADRALRHLGRRPTNVWKLSALLSRSYALLHLRRYREAHATLERTASLLRGSRASIFHALLLEQQATISALLGRPAQALRIRERAVRVSREVANASVLGEALAGLTLSRLECGRPDDAHRSLAELRDVVTRFGLAHLLPWIAYREGQLLWRRGETAGATRSFRAAQAGFRATTRPSMALLPAAYLMSRAQGGRARAAFRHEWAEHEATLDAEEVAAIDPLRAGGFPFDG